MSYEQLVQPTPMIPCQPGWCLQYVRQAFGAPIVEPTATAGWNNAQYKHRDYDFPDNCWVPLWFSLATEPAGHVVLRAPDGRIYSTTNPYQYTPRIHPNLADLLSAYAPYNPLTYLGWTEDISKVRVVAESSITVQGTITPIEENELSGVNIDRLNAAVDRILGRDEQRYLFVDADGKIKPCEPGTPGSWAARSADVGDILGLLYQGQDGTKRTVDEVSAAYHQSEASADQRAADLRSLMASLPASDLAASIPDNLAQDVVDALAARLKGN